ncbi:hypothetical protein [Kibdelosporangium phytohabitans]|uniref:hypothetical protein n=1 Tax=Kibdelosporangium phytohabitans TaxID=860235 RepID=UPI0012F9CFB2|nr:hypothetical protein [Kibdelosporangium phytohabitans]MBE1464779.1 hypothetical protein [Kibdelosporangium phytohabitans]
MIRNTMVGGAAFTALLGFAAPVSAVEPVADSTAVTAGHCVHGLDLIGADLGG